MTPPHEKAPAVTDSSWGEVTVETLGSFRDAKLWPGGGRAWDWNETGTRHEPGIQPADVQELLDHGVEIVVLSRGRQHRLQTAADTFGLLASRGVDVEHEETSEAIERYNVLAAEGRAVGALLHTTC